MSNAMTPEDKIYAGEMVDYLAIKTYGKFEQGKLEHGGHIWDIPVEKLAQEAENEAIDQFTYIYQMRKALKLLLAENRELKRKLNKL